MKIIEKIKRKLGWVDCPVCGEFIRPKFVKDWIYDPEEPTMFGHYYCPYCNVSTPILVSGLVQDVVKNMGFRDFKDYADNILSKE